MWRNTDFDPRDEWPCCRLHEYHVLHTRVWGEACRNTALSAQFTKQFSRAADKISNSKLFVDPFVKGSHMASSSHGTLDGMYVHVLVVSEGHDRILKHAGLAHSTYAKSACRKAELEVRVHTTTWSVCTCWPVAAATGASVCSCTAVTVPCACRQWHVSTERLKRVHDESP